MMTIEMSEVNLMAPDDDETNEFYDTVPLEDMPCNETKFEKGSRDPCPSASSSETSLQFFDASSFQSSQDNQTNNIHSQNINDENKINEPSIQVLSKEIQANNLSNEFILQNEQTSSAVTGDMTISTKGKQIQYSAKTKQFLDLIDLAIGRSPISGYSILKDRIGSLMRNAGRKKWSSTHGPRWSGLGVINIVHTVEKRGKKPADPELIHRKRFVPKKGVVTDVEAVKNAGKWKNEVASDQYVNIPEPSFTEKLRSHMNSIFTTPINLSKKMKQSDRSVSVKKRKNDEMDTTTDIQHLSEAAPKARLIVTSLCENINEDGFNFEEMESIDESDENESIDEEDDESTTPSQITFINVVGSEKDRTIDENCEVEIDEEAEISFAVSSINDYLASQSESSHKESEGTNIYFIEEECVMLSPYSNEAKLYKLLFPGRRLPVHDGESTQVVLSDIEETVTELELCENLQPETCIETVEEYIMECATIEDCLPVLTSPYTDDMWESESEEEVIEVEPEVISVPTPEPIREPTPEPAREPTPEPIREPSPEPIREPTPEPIREPTPEPIREPTPEPIREPTPQPVPEPPKPKREKRKKPEKQKKVYDRNFVKAVLTNQPDLVENMLFEGADPNTCCSIGTVLHQAAQLGFAYTLQVLLWGGSDAEIRNELGDTALHLAAISGHNEVVFALTAYECDVDAGNNFEITPLHMALSYGRLEVIQTLVRMDADLDAEDKIGDTPQMLADQLGYPKESLDPNAAAICPIKEIPIQLNLVHAVENGSLELLNLALTQNASPNTIVPLALHWPGHSTVLHRAAHLGFTDIVKILLYVGASVNARDIVGNTPLHTAVQDGHNDVAKVLLEGGAAVNACTQSGVTPLHRSAAKGFQETMELLISYGADLTIKDNQNRSPIDWARQKGFMIVARNMTKLIA